MKYFTWVEFENNPARCQILPADYEIFPLNTKNGGSYALAPARVIGLDYITYLKFIRQMFPDEVSIEGRNSLYPIAYWRKGKELYTFIDLLNAKLTLAMEEYNANNSNN